MPYGKRNDIQPGARFARLTVEERDSGGRRARGVMWRCRCDCGGITYVAATHLRHGVTRSCGCLRREACYITGTTPKTAEQKARIAAGVKARAARDKRLREAFGDESESASSGYCDRPTRELRPKVAAVADLAAALGILMPTIATTTGSR